MELIMKKRNLRRFRGRIILALLVGVILIWTLFPVYWLVTMSFKSPLDSIADPPKFLFDPIQENYMAAMGLPVPFGKLGFMVPKVDFLRGFINSLIISCGAVALSCAIGLPAAYSLARAQSRLQQSLGMVVLFVRFVPYFAVIIPIYVLFRMVKLYDTHLGLIIAYQFFLLPYLIWLMKGFFMDVPPEIEEAGKVDGCSSLQLFIKITLPLVAPGLVASMVLTFISAWNHFDFGLILSQINAQPVTVALTGYMAYTGTIRGQVAAAGMLVIIPELILVGYIQRYIVRGLTFGFGK
jgi:multiple sugar transport system permease protein